MLELAATKIDRSLWNSSLTTKLSLRWGAKIVWLRNRGKRGKKEMMKWRCSLSKIWESKITTVQMIIQILCKRIPWMSLQNVNKEAFNSREGNQSKASQAGGTCKNWVQWMMQTITSLLFRALGIYLRHSRYFHLQRLKAKEEARVTLARVKT